MSSSDRVLILQKYAAMDRIVNSKKITEMTSFYVLVCILIFLRNVKPKVAGT